MLSHLLSGTALRLDGQAGRDWRAGERGQELFPLCCKQSAAPARTNPVRSVCTKPPRVLPCRESVCLYVDQVQHHHGHEQMGKKSTVQPTVPSCVIKMWCQATPLWEPRGSRQAEGCLSCCRGAGAGISSRKGWEQQCGVKAAGGCSSGISFG